MRAKRKNEDSWRLLGVGTSLFSTCRLVKKLSSRERPQYASEQVEPANMGKHAS